MKLQAALEDSQGMAAQHESRVRELELQAENHAHELEAARAASGRNDRETLTLRDAVAKKDKELLRLRGELHEKEQELVELRERSMTLEQQAGDSAGELARRDAQLKTLTARADQALADKRRVDVALQAAKEEARGATARLSALQAELDGLQGQAADADALRDRVAELENEVASLRGEAEASQGALDDARHEADALRDQLERVQQDLEAARAELAGQQAATGEELDGLRRRVAELEESTARHEERVTKLYARIKGDEKLREKTKKALGIAQQLLDEHPEAGLDLDGEVAA